MACRAVARQSEGWSARDDLHVQGCLILSQVGLLFPVNHAPLKLASLIPPSLRSYCGQARLRSKAATDGCGSNQESLVAARVPEMPIRKRATRSALEITSRTFGPVQLTRTRRTPSASRAGTSRYEDIFRHYAPPPCCEGSPCGQRSAGLGALGSEGCRCKT